MLLFFRPLKLARAGLCALALLCTCATSVGAQDIPHLTKKEKTPEDYAYTPVHYKGLVIEPKLAIRSFYNDNIYATSQNEKTDFIASINPSLKITKEYESAALVANISGKFDRYKNYNNENTAGYLASLGYKNEINSQWIASLGTSYQSQARSRQDPTGLSATSKPLYIDTFSTNTAITRRFNRLSLTLEGKYDNIANENGVSLANPSLPVIFSQNDRNQYTGQLTLQYDLVPGGDLGSLPEKAVYLSMSSAKHDYKELPSTTTSRDRTKNSALAGFIGNFKSLSLSTDFGGGYVEQDFDDNSVETTQDLNFFAKLQYRPNEKHTLRFDALRDITADSAFLEGIVETNFNLYSDYELYHNLYLNSRLGYEINDFDSGQEDNDTIGGLDLRYILSPKIESRIGATYTQRDSTNSTSEFDQTVFMLQLIGRL